MATKIKQYVYKYPTETDISYQPPTDICSLLPKGSMIKVLGLQAPQGTKARVNGSEIIVGPTGVFELDGIVDVESFLIDNTGAPFLRRVIIDIVYKEGE